MNQWSRNRKRIILSIAILTILVLVGVPGYFLFYKSPTCFDGVENGDETGIDCGGSCQLLCRAESLPLILKGDPRVLTLASSTYQVIALVENPNVSAEIYKAGYVIKLYDEESVIPVKEIEGETYAPVASTVAVFEGPFTLKTGVNPKRATLDWKEEAFVWQKNPIKTPNLEIKGSVFSDQSAAPRLEAEVENPSLQKASNIDLVVLVYDIDGNIFAASKTFIDAITPGETAGAVFTWPKPFDREAVSTEIITRIFPDRSFIR